MAVHQTQDDTVVWKNASIQLPWGFAQGTEIDGAKRDGTCTLLSTMYSLCKSLGDDEA